MVFETNMSNTRVRHEFIYFSGIVRARDPFYRGCTVHRSIFGQQDHPKALQPYLPELRAFSEHNHYNVLFPILQYVASTLVERVLTRANTQDACSGYGASGGHIRQRAQL